MGVTAIEDADLAKFGGGARMRRERLSRARLARLLGDKLQTQDVDEDDALVAEIFQVVGLRPFWAAVHRVGTSHEEHSLLVVRPSGGVSAPLGGRFLSGGRS